MDALIQLNKAQVLRSQYESKYRGFVVHGRVVPGVGTVLKRFKLGGDRVRRLSVFSPGRGSGCRLLTSNTSRGLEAHRRICDSLLLMEETPIFNGYADVCVGAARLFASRNNLIHEASELVICNQARTLATRFDALFIDSGSGERELVSWKTGCGPRFEADLVLHKAQLAMEWDMLEAEHEVPVSRATLVYLGALQSISSKHMAPVYQAYNLTRKDAETLRATVERKLAKRRNTQQSGKKKNKKKRK